MSQEKRYEFTVELSGCGSTEVEAWRNALETFFSDPGFPAVVICHDEEVVDDNVDPLLRYIAAQCSEV